MGVYKTTPVYKDYIWGGTKLVKKWNKAEMATLAESWELSTHKDGISLIESKPINEVLKAEELGKDFKDIKIPIIIKLIDAKENLSVQVHPTHDYARDGAEEKTEYWYILDAEEGAGIYAGLKETCTKEEILKSIEEKTFLQHMNFFTVKKGEGYLIEGGIFHAIGAGVTLLEIQQNSNTTYRVYDYGRKDKNGKERELHIEKAIETAVTEKYIPKMGFGEINTPYFATRPLNIFGLYKIHTDESSFMAVFIVSGFGKIGKVNVKKGDTVFISANENVKAFGLLKTVAVTL